MNVYHYYGYKCSYYGLEENRVYFDGILELKQEISAKDYDELKKTLSARYGGSAYNIVIKSLISL